MFAALCLDIGCIHYIPAFSTGQRIRLIAEDGNGLDGTLPTEIGHLQALTILYLGKQFLWFDLTVQYPTASYLAPNRFFFLLKHSRYLHSI